MAKGAKPKTRVKAASDGRTVTAVYPTSVLRGLLRFMPGGAERTMLEAALAEADATRAAIAAEDALDAPLSIESLAPLGWMLVGEHSRIAYGAIREGDFRHEADGTWTFGPPGAFDRTRGPQTILRAFAQPGVMSPLHGVYLLAPPAADRKAAIARAAAMEAEWRSKLPAKPQASHGLMDGMPEGARIDEGRMGARPAWASANVGDVVRRSGEAADGVITVSMFRCDAVLRPVIVAGAGARTTTTGHRWSVARREHDPRFDPPGARRDLSGPRDCVVADVWAIVHNGSIDAEGQPRMAHGATRFRDDAGREAFPLATADEAQAAVLRFAAQIGIDCGTPPEAPTTMPLPGMHRQPI